MTPELQAYLAGVLGALRGVEALHGVRPTHIRVPGGLWPWLVPGQSFQAVAPWGIVVVEVAPHNAAP